MKVKSIANHIFKDIQFSEVEINTIENMFYKVSVKKGDIIQNVGEIASNLYYVDSGCLRAYFLDDYGKEHTIHFAIDNWWMSDFSSFPKMLKSIVTIEALQDSVMYKIDKKDLDLLFEKIHVIQTFFRLKLESAYSSYQKRTLDRLSKTAKERYLDFIYNYPDIVKCVKNYHIASYLGIATETLSRLRKDNE